ncbi:REP-associated tyrosine transposase [Fimbriimonas ginsengisoli]|uniref:Transposase IS200-like domain-containing protein n=1 Tax=Fimbriimonas ginsengisoli Gsoil 348 TaxID=661478 RepID=A0A068NYP6_FIMGI|nr:transposase [Fimbriimonas ginsengisoli]AIE87189.1 hypothetical protein OP10G_3821 [Fimbriimonas ginsengisoli Gsoil 348]
MACEARRKPVLAEPEFTDSCAANLARAAVENGCIVPIYTILPDHVHVLIMGAEDSSQPKKAMERFKYLSGTWLFHKRPGVAWQDDFHDRNIRSSDDWPNHVRYIALNPVRAGLCENIKDWPFTGSIGTDLDEILDTTI